MPYGQLIEVTLNIITNNANEVEFGQKDGYLGANWLPKGCGVMISATRVCAGEGRFGWLKEGARSSLESFLWLFRGENDNFLMVFMVG